MPPTNRKMMAHTACSRTKNCASRQRGNPVVGQMRFPSPGAGVLISSSRSVVVLVLIEVRSFNDDFSDHVLMPNATELIADNGISARRRGFDGQDVIVTGHDLEIHVQRLKRKAMLEIH